MRQSSLEILMNLNLVAAIEKGAAEFKVPSNQLMVIRQ